MDVDGLTALRKLNKKKVDRGFFLCLHVANLQLAAVFKERLNTILRPHVLTKSISTDQVYMANIFIIYTKNILRF